MKRSGGDARAIQDGTSLLLRSVLAQQEEVMLLLLRASADANAADEEGHTVLMAAMVSGNDPASAVEALLSARAAPDVKDSQGHTALCFAANQGFERCCRALLVAGADKDVEGIGN